MRWLVLILILLFTTEIHGQTTADDDVTFRNSIDWLSSKLNYVYYDEASAKWWKNTFYINEDRVVTIKHISSNKLNEANIENKTYIIRKFRIQDINPESLKISTIKNSQGRITKGEMLEMRTYGFQDLIDKTINGRKGSSTSYIYLSFPNILNDSLANYAELVKTHFENATLSSTRISSYGDQRDIETIITILSGAFESESNSKWIGKMIKPNTLQLTSNPDIIQYFGYDENKNQFYLLTITDKGVDSSFFELENQDGLYLKSDTTRIFEFHSQNSFSHNGEKYFRQ